VEENPLEDHFVKEEHQYREVEEIVEDFVDEDRDELEDILGELK